MALIVKSEIFIILSNVRSAHNVGSIFRTAEGAGVSKIFLTGYTPAPVDRFGREVAEIRKTSLGASELVPWKSAPNTKDVVQKLQAEGVAVIAVEQHACAVNYRDFPVPENIAYIFGNEVDGVLSEICEIADRVVEIPMMGKKESLNVSVAAGIILFGPLHP